MVGIDVADHIDGILDLTTELIEADDEDRQSIVNIRQAWHNSFSDVIAAPDTGTSREIKTQSANASQAFDELIRQIRTSTGFQDWYCLAFPRGVNCG